MFDPKRIIYIHGLEGTSQGAKANLLRALFPEIMIPDFPGSLQARMAQLESVLETGSVWTVVGSSLGGLMAAMWAANHPARVRRLVLLAPALIWPDFAANPPGPLSIPTVIVHGLRDEIIPFEAMHQIATRVFSNLEIIATDDDHGLFATAHKLDWQALLSGT